MNDIVNLLGIAVSGFNDTINQEQTDDPKTKAIWIVVLIAIIIASILVARFAPNVSGTMHSRKIQNEKNKVEKERNDELERLHKIKKQNKRK